MHSQHPRVYRTGFSVSPSDSQASQYFIIFFFFFLMVRKEKKYQRDVFSCLFVSCCFLFFPERLVKIKAQLEKKKPKRFFCYRCSARKSVFIYLICDSFSLQVVQSTRDA